MVKMGIGKGQIEESLNLLRFDRVYATYHLLGIPATHQVRSTSVYKYRQVLNIYSRH